MSVLGALNAAVGGMDAQAAALSAISNNVANSQTVGFKETDTSFVSYVTQASATAEAPGQVVALPEYENALQGTVTSVSNPTSLAIAGNGFFPVQMPVGDPGSGNMTSQPDAILYPGRRFLPERQRQPGKFRRLRAGRLSRDECRGDHFQYQHAGSDPDQPGPVPAGRHNTVGITANLGATPPAGTTSYSSTVQIYDAGGNEQTLNLTWSQVAGTPPAPVGTNNVSARTTRLSRTNGR